MRAHITDRSSRPAALAVALTLMPVAIGLAAGCSSTANPPAGSSTSTTAATTTSGAAAPTTSTSGSTTASVEIGNTLNYGSVATTATIDCANGKSLNVAGSNNTLTVTGTCETVTITGMTNNVTFDKINNHLTVLGLNNTVTYKDGSPKVDNLGSGNTVNKG